MLIAALVSSDAWQKIQADPWLALFDWLLLSDVTELTDCKSDLLVLEAGQIPSATPLGLPPQPCWCFDAGPHCWRLSSEVDVFDAPLDVEVLGMRLMAWMWLNNDLTPACFAGLSVSLTNGRLSFSTVEPTHYLMQMSVHPTAGVGGDVALYIESGARTLVVLADAIGHVLSVAAEGIYTLERVSQLEQTQLRPFFLKGCGERTGLVRVKKQLRAAISFAQLNLIADAWPDIGTFDAVFCRNVLIYFDKTTQKAILERLAERMKPNALLFLGHSENIQHLTKAFIPCGRTTYRLAV